MSYVERSLTTLRFSRVIDAYPASFRGNPLHLLYLEEACPILRGNDYLSRLDGPGLTEERREYCLDSTMDWPFPAHYLEGRPDPWSLSQRLFENFELARQILTKQSDIATRIEQYVNRTGADTVVLVIVDGLSYYDMPEDADAQPCLVDGVTITEHGYRAIVGNPSLSRRLFARGYANQVAYTYYSPEGSELAADLHDTFAPPQVKRVRAFSEVLSGVERLANGRTYIQVTLSGLDQLCHAHHDQPPVTYYRDEVLSRFETLIDTLSQSRRRVLAVLCADHGILWRDAVESTLTLIDDLYSDDARWPRYAKGSFRRSYGLNCRSYGQNYTLFQVPYMTRAFRNNEWGVHGGVSAWESLVPLIVREPEER